MAIKKENKWVFIVNPIAGDGRAIKVAEELELKLKEKEIDADIVYTISKGDASVLSERYYNEGFKYIIGVGGDGTFNEVAAPLINKKDVIINGDLPSLQETTGREQEMAGLLLRLEKQREAITSDIALVTNHSNEAMTINNA